MTTPVPPVTTTTRRLKRIAPLQLGLMLGVTYALISIIIIPFFLLFTIGAGAAARAAGHNSAGVAGVFGFGAAFVVVLPILYGVIGFIGGVIGAFVYNLVAKWIGGIEVEVA